MTTTTHEPGATTKIQDVPPALLKTWLDAGDATLIDVREDYEHAEERIGGAQLCPLGKLDPDALRSAHPGARLVFHCRSGKRSHDAASRFSDGREPAFHLAGGIEAWKAAGLPVVRPEGGPRIPIIRQVMLVAGSLVALGVALGVTVSPWFLALAGFVGLGLMFAGITGWCGMAMLLGVMPWNRVRKDAAGTTTCCPS
ncbi:MAG: rhodanese-like domain-containing protein [Phycisphaerales bacterium]